MQVLEFAKLRTQASCLCHIEAKIFPDPSHTNQILWFEVSQIYANFS